MSERKPWTEKVTFGLNQEDQILKQLKQNRKIGKWSQISLIMKSEFEIFGRNGKQCRERYHNHLDSRISKQKWEREEQKMLLALHNQWGNRWAAISRELPGRTDNCVKNHFYSYFRKCIKNVNVLIANHCKKRIRPIKLGIINKIITILEGYHKDAGEFDKLLYEQTKNIKNEILEFGEQSSVTVEKCIAKLEDLAKSMTKFNQTSRNKLMKRKKVKVESDDSEIDINHIGQNDEEVDNEHGNTKDQAKVKHERIDQQVKLEAEFQKQNINFVKEQQHNHNVKTNQVLTEQTPQKQKKDQIRKSSSYLIINSVDYLDVKNQHAHDIKDFIFMDDEKQWKLYFQ